jgi:hypothetical protein
MNSILNQSKNVWLCATSIVLLSSVTSCGSKSDDKGSPSGPANPALIGKWMNGCTERTWFAIGASEEQIRNFSAAGEYEHDSTIYSDGECKAPDVRVFQQGTFTDLGSSANVTNAHEINFTVTGKTLTPRSDSAVENLNKISYCGISSWKKDEPSDVLGRNCLGETAAKGDVNFDIYRLDAATKQLVFGRGTFLLDKGDDDSRPSELDEKHVFLQP